MLAKANRIVNPYHAAKFGSQPPQAQEMAAPDQTIAQPREARSTNKVASKLVYGAVMVLGVGAIPSAAQNPTAQVAAPRCLEPNESSSRPAPPCVELPDAPQPQGQVADAAKPQGTDALEKKIDDITGPFQKIGDKVGKVIGPAFTTYKRDVHGYRFNFTPMSFDADPFSDGFLSMETRTSIADTALIKQHYLGDGMHGKKSDLKFTYGFQGDFLVRYSLGELNKPHDGNDRMVNPGTSFGPRYRMYQLWRLPLDKEAKREDTLERTMGPDADLSALHPTSGHGDGMFTNLFKGGTHAVFETREGFEYHIHSNGYQPTYHALLGAERTFPIKFMGRHWEIAVKAGPEIGGNKYRTDKLGFSTGVDFRHKRY